MRRWSSSLRGLAWAAFAAALAGACGGGGSNGNPGTGGSGPGVGGTGPGTGGLAGTPATGCGHTCAEYSAECGEYIPVGCALAYDCGRCREPLVCGGQGTPNRCARPGTWTRDPGADALLLGDVLSIWGSAQNDVWAGDSWGKVIWWNGSTWELAVDFGIGVTAIHGSSRSNVWFGLRDGTVYQLVGIDLIPHDVAADEITALWVGGPSDVFACDEVLCWRWNGLDWDTDSPDPSGAQDAWGIPGGPLYVVSNQGWMWRKDGQTWTDVWARGAGDQFLSIRGVDAAHIWAAGDELFGFNGGNWYLGHGPGLPFAYYTAVWPSGPRDVWAVGTEGMIVHGDGVSFETQPSPTTEALLSLWGSGPTDIWAGGEGRMLLHYTVPR
jgi:hypothetical protein